MSKKSLDLEFLFNLYCNYEVFGKANMPQKKKKKKKGAVEEEPPPPEPEPLKTKILLPQIACWFHKAQLLNRAGITMDELRLLYLHKKRWYLVYEEFMELLVDICNETDLTMDKLKLRLLEAGPPEPLPEEATPAEETPKALEIPPE